MATGTRLTRTQVLWWREPWSYTDRAMVAAALDAVPNANFVEPPSGGYIGVWAGNRVALTVHPGYVLWARGRRPEPLPDDLFPQFQQFGDYEWHELSTFRPTGGGSGRPEKPVIACPNCNYEIPASGICGECD